MKKLLALILTLCLIFSLVACGAEQTATSSTDTPSSSLPTVSDDTESEQKGEDKPAVSTPQTPTRPTTSTEESAQEKVDPATCVHAFIKATCTEPQHCAKCGTTNGEATGHEFEVIACDKPQECSKCGEKGVTLGHYYKAADCVEPKTCINCNKKVGSALGHKMVGDECSRCNDFSENYAPVLYFTGNMDKMNDKKDVRSITYKYRTRNGVVEGAATIKVQGSSSLAYDKKNYTIKFADSIDVGWGKQKEYCLKANWVDKTHSRNVVTAKLVGEMQKKYGLFTQAPNGGAVDGFPITVYINGEFHGVYTMNIPKAAWQFGMNEDNPNHIVICGEEWCDETYFKATPKGFEEWSVEVGNEDEYTLLRVQRLVNFIKNSSDAEFKKNFSSYLDLDATINYYIMMRFGYMRDNYAKNMLLATYDGKVWYPSLYDLDTTWGTRWDGLSLDSYKDFFPNAGESLLWQKLERCFKGEIAERYFELRSDVLNPNHIMDLFETFYGSIPADALKQEEAKWAKVEGKLRGYGLDQIKEYLGLAVTYFDKEYYKWK